MAGIGEMAGSLNLYRKIHSRKWLNRPPKPILDFMFLIVILGKTYSMYVPRFKELSVEPDLD